MKASSGRDDRSLSAATKATASSCSLQLSQVAVDGRVSLRDFLSRFPQFMPRRRCNSQSKLWKTAPPRCCGVNDGINFLRKCFEGDLRDLQPHLQSQIDQVPFVLYIFYGKPCSEMTSSSAATSTIRYHAHTLNAEGLEADPSQ